MEEEADSGGERRGGEESGGAEERGGRGWRERTYTWRARGATTASGTAVTMIEWLGLTTAARRRAARSGGFTGRRRGLTGRWWLDGRWCGGGCDRIGDDDGERRGGVQASRAGVAAGLGDARRGKTRGLGEISPSPEPLFLYRKGSPLTGHH